MDMKKAGRRMGIMMGAVMSLTLSAVGLISAGRFSFPGLAFNFIISFAASQVLALVLPAPKISSSLIEKAGLKPGTLKARLLDACVSDVCYTPFMTLLMTGIAWRQAVSHGAQIPYLPMFLNSLVISLIAAYIVIFLATPLIRKIAFGENA